MTETPRHSVSVAAAVVREDGRVLAIQRADNGHWEPPGGVLELDETIEDGVRREVREETGVIVEVEALTGVYKNMTRGIVSLVFRCRALQLTSGSDDETRRIEWLEEPEIRERMTEAYAVRLLDALHGADRSAAVRAHDGTRLTA